MTALIAMNCRTTVHVCDDSMPLVVLLKHEAT